ncbi:MAG: magnesium transporter CorA [Firmicutes bacterium]|nr:magnesium transporter CorA [Bacillota bacterium]
MARFLFSDDGRTMTADRWPKHADALWIDLGPDDRAHVHDVVNRLYQAHPQVIERLVKGEHHRPNLLIDDGAISFMLALIPVEPDRPLHHLSFIIGHQFLVTAHLEDASQVIDDAFRYIAENQLMDEGADFALYQVLRGHVVALRALANHLDEEFEGLHRDLLKHPYRDMSPYILALRKRAMAAKHLLDPERGIVELLKSDGFPYVTKKNHPYFQDVSFLMDEVVEEVQATREGLAEMVEAYTSLQSNEINKVMWILTLISVISLPATTIASIYGMNFPDIPELRWHHGYFYAVTLMVLVTIFLLIYVKKVKNHG